MSATTLLASFNAGEISPALYGRVDLAKYYNGCEVLENMIARPHGPAFKRPGTYFVRESMGRDHVTNGAFGSDASWTKGTGWTIAGGKAVGAAGTASNLYQDTGDLTESEVYEIIFTLSDRTAGSVTPKVGGTSGTIRTTNAEHTERITCGSTDVVTIAKTSNFDGKIDDISVRQVAPVTRLEAFQFSTVQAYVLAFTDKNIRIFKDNGVILDGADPYEVTTPYLAADLFDLQITQSADVMTLVHEDYKQRELTRTGHTSWTLTEIEFKDGPWEEQKDTGDLESMTITGVTQADPCVITVDHQDAENDDYIEITGVAGMTELNGNFYQLANKGAVFETYSLKDMAGAAVDSTAFTAYTSGGLAKCTLKPSHATGPVTLLSWKDMFAATDVDRLIRIKSQKIDEWAVGTAYVTGDYALNGENYKCILDNTGKEPPNAMYWEESGKDGWYWAKITAYTSAEEVTATIEGDDLPNAYPITDYRMGIWCEANGYPSCVDYFEERLMFAGSTEYPQTVWASESGNYDVFAPGSDDDDAFTYTIAAKGVNPIRWIVPQNVLLIGTMGAEWKLGSSTIEEPISAANINVRRQSTWGSKSIQALLVNDVVLFVQRAGTKLRELTYSFEKDGYVAPDLTILAEHITEGGIVDIAYQQEPSAILWCIRDDGVLLGMTYERTQDVVGWHRHITDGEFESVAVIPDTEDEIWTVVKRTIDSEDKRYIEYFKPHLWGSDVMDCFFVDSGITSDKGATLTITGVTQADPALVTCANTFAGGEKVKILGIEGMTELNENIYIVDNENATDFEILDLDGNNVVSTAFAAYVSGGTVQEVAEDYSGLDHLEGKTVSILADGCVQTPCVVSGGEITISDYANLVHVGLPFSPKLKPMNLEAGQREGTAQGKIKRIHKATVRLQDTMACKVGSCDDDLEEISFRSDSDPMDAPVPLFTGDKELNMFPGGYDTSGDILITNDVPLPLTVVAIMPSLRTYEG